MGLVVSFYSYKGGVGRTQLAANLAAYLCYHKGRKILLVEWDLEAPGLHYYFKKEDDLVTETGLMELLEEYVRLMRSNVTDPAQHPAIEVKNILNLVNDGKEYMGRKGKIDLFPAGNYQNNFSKRVNEFNWEEFKTLLDGNMYIDSLGEQLRKLDYDYVFIDSRTGVSDYSGYCTILLPDMNIFVIAPNSQNYKGSERIARNILAHPYVQNGHRKPYILPILSRLDIDAKDFEEQVENFNKTFNFMLNTWGKEIDADILPLLFDQYFLKNTWLQYTLQLATGENLLFNQKAKSTSTLSIQQNFEYIANYFLEKVYEKKQIDLEENVKAEDWVEWGKLSLENQNYEKASDRFEKAKVVSPNDDAIISKIVRAYISKKEYGKANDTINSINDDNWEKFINNDEKVHKILGHFTYNDLRKVYFFTILQENNDPQIIYEIQKEYDQDELFWVTFGINVQKISEEKALECLNKAYELNPNRELTVMFLANLYEKKDKEKSIFFLQKAIILNPDLKVLLYSKPF